MNSLKGKYALITGAGRKNGIGYAIANLLVKKGADLILHSFNQYDALMMGPEEVTEPDQLIKSLLINDRKVKHFDADFSLPGSADKLFNFSLKNFDHIDILVLNHTYDTLKTLDELTTEEIELHLKVNISASLLLIQNFARQHDGRPGGRIVLLTSGQHLGPMPHPAYVASKGALHHLTWSLSDQLIGKNITVNAVNPGPTLTYTPERSIDLEVLRKMPQGRWGQPDDAARLISWLVSEDAQWVTGQVIDSEGGFRRG